MAETMKAWLVVMLLFVSCSGGETSSSFVDMARVAEVLRREEVQLTRSCGNGFRGFTQAAQEAIATVPGTETYQQSMVSYSNVAGQDPSSLPDPALLRLILQKYGSLCNGGRSVELSHRLTELSERDGDMAPGTEISTELIELLQGYLPGAEVDLREVGGSQVILEIPATVLGADDDGRDASLTDERRAEAEAPMTFLACLRCRPEQQVTGPDQIAATLGAFDAFLSSGITLSTPLRLVICLDVSTKPENCAEHFDQDTLRSRAAFALDGAEPLVIAWSAEVSWHLELTHNRADAGWMESARRRVGRHSSSAPYVIEAGAEATLDELPVEAWMVLFDPQKTVSELVAYIENEVTALESLRQGVRFEVRIEAPEGEPALVRVTAHGPPRFAWEIVEGRNALWDLAALADRLHAIDPPRGGCASMLRVVGRFDGDSNGRRLGLSYADPVGGPLLVAPCSLSARDGNVILGVRMYRPPGLERRAFLRRLDDARARLRHAIGRSVGVAEQTVGDPSVVAPDSNTVRIVRETFEGVTGEPPPEPSGATRPGLGTLLPQAVSLRPPTQSSRVSAYPTIAFLVDLAWFMAVAVDPEVRRASQWR